MTEIYFERDTCRLCNSTALDNVVPLAPMPIATPNFRVPEEQRSDEVYRKGVPLDLHLCRDCGHLQVLCVGNPELQYRNYVYTTSLSVGLRRHFAAAADTICDRLRPAPGALVVEMGSNDGTLLRFFKNKGLRVQGVDPARRIAEQATVAGIETLPAFFGRGVAEEIRAKHGPASIVVANNMIANIDVLDDLAGGVRSLLADDGAFVIETQYGADVIRHNLLDTVYHEHLSYFNVRPLRDFLARFDLEVFDVETIDTKGGSIRVFAQPKGAARPVAARVGGLIGTEEREGHYDGALYARYVARLEALRAHLHALVGEAAATGRPVAGFGVSVGTTTLLPQLGLTHSIDFLVDDDPDKDPSMIGPDYEIPVVPAEELYRRDPAAVVIFAWRYADLIIEKHRRYTESGGRFIVPLPDVTVRP